MNDEVGKGRLFFTNYNPIFNLFEKKKKNAFFREYMILFYT